MNVTAGSLAATLVWSAVAGLAAWLLLTPVRRRSLTGLLVTLVLTGAAASAGGLWAAVQSMLVPGSHWATLLVLTAASGTVTAVAAVAVGRRLARENETLRSAVTALREGRLPAVDGRPLSSEVDAVRRELRDTAAELAATRTRERALEASRRELVSWVSHDLRTPLAGLRAMAEALEDGVAEDPERYYKQIAAAVDRLNLLVDDLFDLSRIQAGGLSRDVAPLDVTQVVTGAVAALQPLATAQTVTLRASYGSRVLVPANARELNRALTNVIANAVRHTPADGTVEVAVADHDATITITVSDQCGGIAPEHLSRVFDVGFRGEAARSPGDGINPAGAGLGLAIARGIVEAHGGGIAVTNTDVGCRFALELPAYRSSPPA